MSTPVLLGYSKATALGHRSRLHCPVILVRGLGRSSGFWLEFLEFVRTFSDVYCIDLFGTGKSKSRLGRGTVESNAADLAHTIKNLGLERCHLIGISFGGMVALEASRSVNCLSLTVMSSSARCTKLPRLRPLAGVKLVCALRNRPPKNEEFAEFLVAPRTLQARPSLPSLWDEIWKREGFEPVAVVRQLVSAALFDGSFALSSCQIPTHFMVGGRDGLVHWENSLEMWRRSGATKLTVLPHCGHDFPTDEPEISAAAVFRFCSDVESHQTDFNNPSLS
jgi:pimeloyl-ACP methyl ester carboxylesterase